MKENYITAPLRTKGIHLHAENKQLPIDTQWTEIFAKQNHFLKRQHFWF